MKISKLLAFISFGLVLAQPAFSLEQPLTYPEVLDSALNNSPLVRQIEAQAQHSIASGLELSTMQNPEISAEVRPYVSGGEDKDQEYEVGVSIPLRLSDLTARGRLAALTLQVADVDKKIALVNLSQEIRLTYARAWLAQERLTRSSAVLKRVESVHKKLHSASASGSLPRSTAKLIDAQLAKIKVERLGNESDKLRAQSDLVRKVGLTVEAERLAPLKLDEVTTEISAGSTLPISERQALRTSLSKTAHQLARYDSYTQARPRLAFEHTDDGDDRIIAGLSFDLPLFDRNQAGKLRAAADYAQAVADQTFYSGPAFIAAANDLKASANNSLTQFKMMKEEVIPALQVALTEAEREMTAGQGSPSQLIQCLSELIDAENRYLELWQVALLARIELSALLGQEV